MSFWSRISNSASLLTSFSLVFWLTQLISSIWVNPNEPSISTLVVIYIIGLLFLLFVSKPRGLKYIFAAYAIFCFLNLFNKWINFQQYGDYGSWYTILATRVPISEWFLGTKIVIWLYQITLLFTSSSPAFLLSNFARLIGIIWMLGWTFYFLKSPIKYRNLLVITSPLWILFISGYSEYYPFVMPLYLWLLNIVFDLKKEYLIKNWAILASLAGLLPLVYIGFLPLSIYLILGLIYLNRENILAIVSLPILVGIITITLLHPNNSLYMYLVELNSHFNWGDTNTSFPRYIGKAASAHSITFSLSYVSSLAHQYDTIFHLWFGGSILTIVLLIRWLKQNVFVIYEKIRNQKKSLYLVQAGIAFIIFCSHVYYLYFLIPKLGPQRDIDLFFNSHLIFAYTLGYIFDYYPPKPRLIGAIVGYNLIITLYLLVWGIPYLN